MVIPRGCKGVGKHNTDTYFGLGGSKKLSLNLLQLESFLCSARPPFWYSRLVAAVYNMWEEEEKLGNLRQLKSYYRGLLCNPLTFRCPVEL